MHEEGNYPDALSPIAEEWALFAGAVLPGMAADTPLARLLRVAYYSGILTMMGKMDALAEGTPEGQADGVARATQVWHRELEAFGLAEATDENVDHLIAQCIAGTPAGAVQH